MSWGNSDLAYRQIIAYAAATPSAVDAASHCRSAIVTARTSATRGRRRSRNVDPLTSPSQRRPDDAAAPPRAAQAGRHGEPEQPRLRPHRSAAPAAPPTMRWMALRSGRRRRRLHGHGVLGRRTSRKRRQRHDHDVARPRRPRSRRRPTRRRTRSSRSSYSRPRRWPTSCSRTRPPSRTLTARRSIGSARSTPTTHRRPTGSRTSSASSWPTGQRQRPSETGSSVR